MSATGRDSEADGFRPAAPELREDQRNGIPANRARQGVTGHHVRRVLAFGTVGAVIVLAAVYWLVATQQLHGLH